jgi:hypothetical protein
MQAVANSPKFAKKVGVPQSVGKEFTKAGGGTMKSEMKKVASTAVKGHEKRMHGAKKGGAMKMAAGGKFPDGCAVRGKTKGTMVTMAKGGKMYKKGGRAC